MDKRVVLAGLVGLGVVALFAWRAQQDKAPAAAPPPDAATATAPPSAASSAPSAVPVALAPATPDASVDERPPRARRREPPCPVHYTRNAPPPLPPNVKVTSFLGAALVEGADHAKLKAPGVRWQRWHLVNTKLGDAELPFAELDGALLRDVDLEGASLRDAHAHELRAHGVTFDRADLTDIDLRCAELHDASFAGVKFGGALLLGANLTKARGLETASLEEADLRLALYDATTRFAPGFDPAKRGAVLLGPKADLSGMVLAARDLEGAVLVDANMRDMDLRGANLAGTDLSRADLRGSSLVDAILGSGGSCARFEDTLLPDGTRWTGCGGDLKPEQRRPPLAKPPPRPAPPRSPTTARVKIACTRPTETGALKKLAVKDLVARHAKGERVFTRSTLDGEPTLPDGTSLRGANLSFSVWQPGIRAPQLDFTEGSLRGAKVSDLKFHGAKMGKVDLSFAGTSGLDVTDADMTESVSNCAELSMARLVRTKLVRAKLRGTHLSGARLSGADLEGADLLDADYDDHTFFPVGFDPRAAGAIYSGPGAELRGRDLRTSSLMNLDDADLQDANLEGANLEGAHLRRADLRGAKIRGAIWSTAKAGPNEEQRCTTFDDTIMPDGERYSGCPGDLPAQYR